MSDNVCRNCKWASWDMTNHAKPRIKKDNLGRCGYPLQRIALPISTPDALEAIAWRVNSSTQPHIRFRSDEPCRVWEKAGL